MGNILLTTGKPINLITLTLGYAESKLYESRGAIIPGGGDGWARGWAGEGYAGKIIFTSARFCQALGLLVLDAAQRIEGGGPGRPGGAEGRGDRRGGYIIR